MKKISSFPLSIPLFILLLLGCGSDDGSNGEITVNLDAIGIWDLVEVNVSSAQDIDMDGTFSTNLVDEVDCISGTILIDGDLSWTFEQSGINITAITGDQYFAQCSGTNTAMGTWSSSGSQVNFNGSSALGTLTLTGDRLARDVGDDLPGILSFVYELR